MENGNNKKFWINMRRDSGELRLIIAILFCIVAVFFGFLGFLLIKQGVMGEWSIVSSFRGWTLYFTSISPGLVVFIFAVIILVYGLPKTLKNL